MIWQRYPIFRIFLVFCAGILLANFTHTSFSAFRALLAAASLFTLLAAFGGLFSNFRKRWVFGFSLCLFFFSLGVAITHLYSERPSPHHLATASPAQAFYLVELLDDPQEKERSVGVQAEVVGLSDSTGLVPKHTKLMLYLQKTSAAKNLVYGDRVLIRAQLSQLSPPMNPHEFDYKNYLNLKAVYFQVYADSNHWKMISHGHGLAVYKMAKDFRKKMLGIIDKWHLDDDQKAVTKALLLGYRYDIKDDLLQAYSSAGAMHVLAVSGLHVGIVYLMAAYLLFFLEKIKYGNVIKTAILVLLLWSYAMITGLSASVVRAATMFTFVAFGTGLKRYTSIYNTILGSAIVLMLFKPTFIFEVGFQLSYAAVFGIVWLQPRLRKLWKPGNWFLKQFWGITTVSIAAQIATFPLGLYYFHQFPALFLISNWMVIPIVTVLMYIGLGCLVISAMGWIPHFFVAIYGGCLWLMNAGVGFIEEQAAFLISHIHITRFELVLLYLFIVLIFNWLFRGGYYRLLTALGVVVILGISQLFESYQLKNTGQMVVYSVRGHPAIGFYQDGKGVFISDTTLWEDDDALTFHIKHHWWAMDVEDVKFCSVTDTFKCRWFYKKNDRLSFSGRQISLLSQARNTRFKEKCWIVTDRRYPPKSIIQKPERVVLCGGLNFYDRRRWHDWARQNGVRIWDTAVKGAFVEKLGTAPVISILPGSG